MHTPDGILMYPVAHIRSDFPTKFGIPKQSGLSQALEARVVFCPEYRSADAVRGLEEFSHIWLLWQFSAAVREGETFSPTVRPPRLGGNKRMGVFATRSPNRPNPIGLSAVRLEKISFDEKLGAVLEVSGIDMMNGTSIYDIKPYLSFADSYPHAVCGFAAEKFGEKATVEIPESIADTLDAETLLQLKKILEEDPRPHYQNDPDRVYGFTFKDMQIRFCAAENRIKVLSAVRIS